eukprot:2632955-Rhodomonas_salina.1
MDGEHPVRTNVIKLAPGLKVTAYEVYHESPFYIKRFVQWGCYAAPHLKAKQCQPGKDTAKAKPGIFLKCSDHKGSTSIKTASRTGIPRASPGSHSRSGSSPTADDSGGQRADVQARDGAVHAKLDSLLWGCGRRKASCLTQSPGRKRWLSLTGRRGSKPHRRSAGTQKSMECFECSLRARYATSGLHSGVTVHTCKNVLKWKLNAHCQAYCYKSRASFLRFTKVDRFDFH